MTKNEYLKILFEKLTDFIKRGKEYNISITSQKFEVKEMEETQPPKWAQDLMFEMRSGFKQVNSRLDNLEQDMSLIKSLPTIQKEIKELER